MKFSVLMEKAAARGVVVEELRVGRGGMPTPWSDGSGGNDPEITGVCEDSRKVKAGDLFVARGGTKVDGAKYIADALQRGAVAVVTEMIVDIEGTASARVVDANKACAILAHEVAGNPTSGMKMIGITGTKGKTTVAYLLRSVLRAAGHKVGMIGTVEIDTGGCGNTTTPADMTTPGSVELVELFKKMRTNGTTHCVMEVSSHALHQHRTAGIDFAVAIFTNLTGDHLDYHKTMEDYAAAKAMLFEGLKEDAIAVVNADDKWAERMLKGCRGRMVPYKVSVVLGESHPTSPEPPGPPDAGWAGLVFSLTSTEMGLHVRGKKGPPPHNQHVANLHTTLVGKHNAANLLAVVAAISEMGVWDSVHNDAFQNALEQAKGAPGRLQRVSFEQVPFQVFVDYAHTHDALENVLNALLTTMKYTERPPEGDTPNSGGTPVPRLICLFGCGGDRDRTKRPKMASIAERLADKVIVTSDNPRTENPLAIIEEICAGFSSGWREAGKITLEADRRAAIQMAIGMAQPGDVVLLAGKGHENYQIIGTTKHHFDDVEEAQRALAGRLMEAAEK